MSVDYNIAEDGMQDIHCLCIDQDLTNCLKLINSWMVYSSSAYVNSISFNNKTDLKDNQALKN